MKHGGVAAQANESKTLKEPHAHDYLGDVDDEISRHPNKHVTAVFADVAARVGVTVAALRKSFYDRRAGHVAVSYARAECET